jgi:hypothetical protein
MALGLWPGAPPQGDQDLDIDQILMIVTWRHDEDGGKGVIRMR